MAERAILVGLSLPHSPLHRVEEYLDELAALVEAAGGEPAGRIIQGRDRPDAATFIGKGKAEELAALCADKKAALVVFDDELSPAQIRNLEKILTRRVCDRTAIILDIFARRARTREAKTQVELAQYAYLLPRLTRAWSHLSRQAGGIGTRGVGETQLETDRRVIKRRMALLNEDLRHIAAHRNVQARRRRDTFEVALVGYTNAGKSSLMNRLTSAHVRVDDRPFVTLDTTFRKMPFEGVQREVVLIDTVGFVRKLPHALVASFRSTLQQAREADLVIIVVDVSHPSFEEQASTTLSLLAELDLGEIPAWTVLNKVDQAHESLLARAQGLYPDAIPLSAKTGTGLGALKDAILRELRRSANSQTLLVPYDKLPLLKPLLSKVRIVREEYGEQNVSLTLQASDMEIEGLEEALRG